MMGAGFCRDCPVNKDLFFLQIHGVVPDQCPDFTDAFQLGYKVVVASNTTDTFTEEDYISGIRYLKEIYCAEVFTVDEFV